MEKTIEERFEKAANDCIKATDPIVCTPEEYRAGLRSIIEELQDSIAASKEGEGQSLKEIARRFSGERE